jgi:thiol-disulfide isomerase/thioredoxin
MRTILSILVMVILFSACDDESIQGQFVDEPLILNTQGDYTTKQCGPDIYPCPPYGTNLYQVVRNIQFLPANESAQSLSNNEGIAGFKSFYDMESQGFKLLVVIATTEWCEVCEAEMEALDEMVAQYGIDSTDPSVLFLAVVTEDDSLNEATLETAERYSLDHHLDSIVPVTNDGNGFFRELMSSPSYPLNIFIDLNSMEIIDYESGLGSPEIFSEKLEEMLDYVQ